MAINQIGFGFYAGLSGDTKPTLASVNNGATFLETDTHLEYTWVNTQWVINASGGIGEAPEDGLVYGRKNAEWVNIINAILPYSGKITTVPALIPSDITDFAAVVTETNVSAEFWSVVIDENDVFITDSGGTQIPFDVVYFDKTNEKLQIRFLVTLLSGSVATDFYIKTGTPTVNTPTDVYRSDLVGYWACVEEPTGVGAVKDRTINAYHMDSVNMDASNLVDGKFGKALTFNGTDEYTIYNAPLITNYPFTILRWCKSPGSVDAAQIGMADNSVTDQYITNYIYNATEAALFSVRNIINSIIYGPITTVNVFNFIASTGTNSTARGVSVNGSVPTTDSTNNVSIPTSMDNTTFGALKRSAPIYDPGVLDEVRIYNTVLSADEITTIYNNENDPSAFWV